jgi:hypothetical protein
MFDTLIRLTVVFAVVLALIIHLAGRAMTYSDLNHKQQQLAKRLRTQRPMCIPGTDRIIVKREAEIWHALVVSSARELCLEQNQVTAFCNACGISE